MFKKDARREKMLEILSIAKANDCRVFISSKKKRVPYGAIIFPDNIIIGVYENIYIGWDFAIIYKNDPEKGNGCHCTNEPVTTVTWETIKEMKGKGIERAKELNVKFYESMDDWKGKPQNKDLVKL